MRKRIIWIIALAGTLASGCTSAISDAVLQKVNPHITFEALKEEPRSYRGELVLLAGVIVNTTVTPAGAVLEVYQTEMDWEHRPENPDLSEGRFLVQHKGFLDPEIYSQGRKVTVAGKVLGKRVMKLGEMEYAYPLIEAEELHLWKKREPLPGDPYPWYPMGGPWGVWGPWYPWYYPYGYY
ncbi:MAG: Slp family lipoprotein [Deltaproteobacteria bacterium]|nr:Slp family lipoprotein [Deltaproteobacteria bacterium]